MLNSKFHRVLSLLSQEDKRLLKKYIKEREKWVKPELVRLLRYGLQYGEVVKKIEDNKVFTKVFDQVSQYNDKLYRYLLSDGIKFIEQFLIGVEMKGEKAYQQLLLARAYRKRKLSQQHKKVLQKAVETIEANRFRNTDYHFILHQFYKEELEHQFVNNRRGVSNFELLNKHLQNYFLIESLMSECTRLSYKVHNPEQTEGLIDQQLLLTLAEKAIGDSPAIELYQSVFFLLKNPNDLSYYENLKTIAQKNFSAFPLAEAKDILLLIINFCIRKINEKEKRFLQECYDWYQLGLKEEILLEDGFLSPYTYKNVITICLKGQKNDLAHETLISFKPFLEKGIAENIYQYNLARIHFNQKNYSDTIEILNSIKYRDLLDELDGRRMLLRIYYEKGEWILLDSFILSFIAFINRQKNLGYHKEYFLNLVRYVKKSLPLQVKDQKRKNRLIQEIKAVQKMNDKEWLLTQLGLFQ